MDENNKSILSDEEIDQVAGGYGYVPFIFSPSGKKTGAGSFEWEFCNNAHTSNCGPGKCIVHGSSDCIDGWLRQRK